MHPIVALVLVVVFLTTAGIFFKRQLYGWALGSLIGVILIANAYLLSEVVKNQP